MITKQISAALFLVALSSPVLAQRAATVGTLCGGKPCATNGCVRVNDEEICAAGLVMDSSTPMSMREDLVVVIPQATPEQKARLREFLEKK